MHRANALLALSYGIITPLVMGFTAVGIALLYVANRYMLMYVLDTANITTQGANYPRALQHLLVGVYISLLCLIGLLAIETGSESAAAGPLIIVIILLVVIILGHVSLRSTLKPLTKNLPRDLLYASTRKMGVDSQLENGQNGTHPHAMLGQNESTMSDGDRKEMAQARQETVLNSSKHQPGMKGMLLRIIHPSWLPPLAPHLSVPGPDYHDDVRREAYLHPAITSPTPLLWIVHDEMGVSAREKELSGKVIGVTDQGAFWTEKNKLQTIWEGQPYEKQDTLIQQAPLHEPKVHY